MGETQKVFGNPQHSYTQSLLTAVPQLHKRWSAVNAGTVAGATGNGHAGAKAYVSNGHDGEEMFPDLDGARYSKSSLHPAATSRPDKGAQDQTGARHSGGPRPSLMDIPDQPWQRRFGLGAPKLDDVLAADDTQALVECEPGHFVAVEAEL
jgi:hypothetical protein